MTNTNDKRLIEHYIPIKQISAEASREKSIRHGHISTLHLWWARRPLVACRAAVFAALVPAPKNAEEDAELNDLMIELCKWEVSESTLDKARRRIREAYPDAPPKVLDMFAGGGSIPLEALRLGCEAYALDLNPVAHIIELATLVYPQKYGKKLAEDVRKWGEWVLERVRAEVGDLYPLIPDPEFTPEQEAKVVAAGGRRKQLRLIPSEEPEQMEMNLSETEGDEGDDKPLNGTSADVPFGYLQPVAYLWTRTVICPNPNCRATVPLVRQTWLKKKAGDNVALAMTPHPSENRMAFYVRHARNEAEFGFDPAGFSQRGNSVCGRCGTTVTSDYVKVEGKAGRMGAQMMATVCVRPGAQGKVYLSPDDMELPQSDDKNIHERIELLTASTGITPPDEEIETNPRSMDNAIYGFNRWSSLYTPRQMLALLTFVQFVRAAHTTMVESGEDIEYAKAIAVYLGIALDKIAEINNTLCRWEPVAQASRGVFGRQSLPMIWDFGENIPISGRSGSWNEHLGRGIASIYLTVGSGKPATVFRGSATSAPYGKEEMDAIITDPPYYDNVSYSNLSDFFYVWLKRSIGFAFPEHFANDLTPKKNEAIAAVYRHDGSKDASRQFYENLMGQAFEEAHRVLKPKGILTVVYAHKTTAGWSTLVDSLRRAGFAIVEAWPLDTENISRLIAQDTAALASSFFLVTRKRENGQTGDYVAEVQPEMQEIVDSRVKFLINKEVTGADLNIAAIGAGLAPYTRFARVELPNGEELTAAAYLDEVQAQVVRVLLGEAADADDVTQYYLMARQNYGEAWVEFDEANNLARAIGVELDTGPIAVTRGANALVEKKGAKVRLRNYAERGEHEALGLSTPERPHAPLVDVLHRLLWLADHSNRDIPNFLQEARLSNQTRRLLRIVAESLKGRALAAEPTPGAVKDTRTDEQKAIDRLLPSWKRVVDEGGLI